MNTAIKPIETLWKGYRFRSRLEARWAVFFETLGLNWEYEPEGFELPDGSRYLPDFYLPDQGRYIEIKPPLNRKFEQVYLAGKFSSKWRDEIVECHSYSTWDCDWFRNDFYFNTCVGPFRAKDDSNHCSDVAPCTHGLLGYYGNIEYCKDTGWEIASYDYAGDQYKIKKQCLSAIDRCTVFFAWIDSLDCYGTLAEIGYAVALGKRVLIGVDSSLKIPDCGIRDINKPHNIDYQDDLWFIKSLALRWTASKSPKLAYEYLLGNPFPEIEKIRQFPKWLFISGNPYTGEYIAISNRHGGGDMIGKLWLVHKRELVAFGSSGEDKEIAHALSIARAARFERGEQP